MQNKNRPKDLSLFWCGEEDLPLLLRSRAKALSLRPSNDNSNSHRLFSPSQVQDLTIIRNKINDQKVVNFIWCGEEDLNLHERNAHQPLKLTRLPIPPPPHRLFAY